MAVPPLCVSWNDHSSVLATLCKTILYKNFLVDCTIAAEGQSLKVHRLILSACSPYFHMLFSEESEKHPIVILKDAAFETLKSVVDFVYHGETQIQEGQLEAFLSLAKSLQIKGLNNSLKSDGNKKLSCKAEGNVLQCSSSGDQDCEVQGTSAGHGDSPGNSSQEHLHRSGGHANAVLSISSASFEGRNDSCEEDMRSGAAMMPLEEQQILSVCDESSLHTEITVKHEPLFSVFLEPNDDHDVENDEPAPGDFMSNVMDVGKSAAVAEQNLNQYSGSSVASHENVQSTLVMSPAQQQQQQVIQLSLAPDPVVGEEPLLPVILVPKCEQIDDEDNEEPKQDLRENDANKMDEVAESVVGEQNPAQCSGAAGPPAVQRMSARKSVGPGNRLHVCSYCHKPFRKTSHFREHVRRHTGERPFKCSVCGAGFTSSAGIMYHMRKHTGERPFKCSVCGASFASSSGFVYHQRKHTGERPFRCDVCGKCFIQSGHLTTHMRKHIGERLSQNFDV